MNHQYLGQGLQVVPANGGVFALQQATEGGYETVDIFTSEADAYAFLAEVARREAAFYGTYIQ